MPTPPFDLKQTDALLSTTRAVRKRLDLTKPVPRELILDCIRLSQQAPTGSNAQTWRWLVVTEPKLKQEIARIYREGGAQYLELARTRAAEGGDAQTKRVYDSAFWLIDRLAEVPALVIPCVIGRPPAGAPPVAHASVYGSIFPAVWSFQLALRSRGLGSVLTTLHLFREQEVAKLLGIPEGVAQVALLPVAYTKGSDFKPAARPAPETITRWNRWEDLSGAAGRPARSEAQPSGGQSMGTVALIAEKHPDRVALIYGNGEARESFGELELRSRRLAQLLRRRGLERGDCVAALVDNADPVFMHLFWACHRVGLYFTPVNWHLQEDEICYVVDDSDAVALFASRRFAESAARVATRCPKLRMRVLTGGEAEGFETLASVQADVPEDAPLDAEREGAVMLYSSGTTGRPKGVRRPLPDVAPGDPSVALFARGFLGLFGIGEGDRYLCPAPLYHAAPIVFSTNHLRIGASVILLPRFDAEQALRVIQDQRATSSQWVPTHFRRLLQLPERVRLGYDLSSLRVAVHAAAPCPIPVKRAMIEWWGDAIVEYYGGTEGGGTLIRAKEWLTHEGSVGRHWTGGKVWILDEEGREVTQPGVEGAVYFDSPANGRFSYHKDAAKTAATWRGDRFTIGDIGYRDAEGYLFLTDRQSNMIISGGVNIYPQETENHLIVHPKVDDVAVIGVPDEEMGEAVKAVVIPAAGALPGPELERELIEHCRQGIAHYKCPRTIDFVSSLPRTETGKMAKRQLRARYWEGHASKLV